ncbi:MAG TPA: DNA-processing protein DprA [Candidatus Udaeobacter sp.]|jgi:DNA processing protein|nr:DNA-processing protein DprA [Candidatus Udaeobacter sp.]
MVEASLSPVKEPSVTVPMCDERAPWLALGRVKGLGCVGFKKLAARFADPAKIFSASSAELEQIEGLHRDVIDGLLNFSDWVEIDNEIRRSRDAGIDLVPFASPNYPARLRMIADPPPCLYVKGSLRAEDDKAVAIVGSRIASDYGRRVARDLARGLAYLGFTVVSGMARGIDGTAHETVLQSGGRTIAVLGSGVDRAYPPEHGHLYRRISENGAVISELPIGTRPLAFNFPARNRLISGLSLGVVVVEATEKSGSLITASMAVEQGREVFAVPGEAGASRSRGAHRLIRQGAKLVETVDDIIEEIAPQLMHRSGRAVPAAPRTLPANASDDARMIFALLQDNNLQVDQVIERSALPTAQVLEILLDLELQGFVRQAPGKIYRAER